MNANRSVTTVIAALITSAAAISSSHAAFQIRRVVSAGTIDAAAPAATVATSPFDDSAARLSDGANYFYAVYDGAGRSVPISIQRNAAAGCVRVSFDDGNPASAPVASGLSTVTLSPSTVRADGVQTAVALITPRDAAGVLLGRGLAVAVDPSLLWPGRLTGAIEDLGDGRYRARIVSSTPGTGAVDVTVEGIALAAAPEVTFAPLDPNGSLRDLAILRLRDLDAPDSRFAALANAAGAGSPQAASIRNAWDEASGALDTLANGDLSRDDNVLKTDLDRVLRTLAPLLDNPGTLDPADVRDLMDDLLDIARLVALHHLDLASASCGACVGGAPRKVCDAADAFAEAEAARGGAQTGWSAAVDAYARCVARAVQAENNC